MRQIEEAFPPVRILRLGRQVVHAAILSRRGTGPRADRMAEARPPDLPGAATARRFPRDEARRPHRRRTVSRHDRGARTRLRRPPRRRDGPTGAVRGSCGGERVLVRSATKMNAEAIAAAPVLRVIARAGVGLDNVDIKAATEAGVMVVNAPTSNIISAAELTVGHILSLARHIPAAHASLAGGQWKRSSFTGTELYEKTVGIVGLGRIGALIAARLQAFGMNVVAYDPYVTSTRAQQLGVTLLTLDELLAKSDFITIHMPKTPETTGMIGAEQLRRMKPTAYVVNVARGGLIDEDALFEALTAGEIAGRASMSSRASRRPTRACSASQRGRDSAPGRIDRRGAGEGGRRRREVRQARPRGRPRARRRQRRGRRHRPVRPSRHRARRDARSVLQRSRGGCAHEPRHRGARRARGLRCERLPSRGAEGDLQPHRERDGVLRERPAVRGAARRRDAAHRRGRQPALPQPHDAARNALRRHDPHGGGKRSPEPLWCPSSCRSTATTWRCRSSVITS